MINIITCAIIIVIIIVVVIIMIVIPDKIKIEIIPEVYCVAIDAFTFASASESTAAVAIKVTNERQFIFAHREDEFVSTGLVRTIWEVIENMIIT